MVKADPLHCTVIPHSWTHQSTVSTTPHSTKRTARIQHVHQKHWDCSNNILVYQSGYDYEIRGPEVTRDEKGPITRMNKQKPKERKTSSKRVKLEQKIQPSLQHL